MEIQKRKYIWEQPEGYVAPEQEHKVCRLVKSLYGLKQAPKQWHKKFNKVLKSNGFNTNEAEKCLYTKYVDDSCIILCLYVDDMSIFGSNIHVVENTKRFLSSQFDMKDIGEVDVILRIKIHGHSSGITLSQSHQIEKVLKKFNQFEGHGVSTPFDLSVSR